MQETGIDNFDRKILVALQADGRLSNADLSDRVNLSASQCARRRVRLEEAGWIKAYHAELDRELLDFGLVNLISVTLAHHNRDNAKQFAELIASLPEVTDAYVLTGEMDYMLKVMTRDLKSLSAFVNEILLPHGSVQNVKTAIVLETIKENGGLPL